MNQTKASPPRKRRSPYNLFFACERELILGNAYQPADENVGAGVEKSGFLSPALKDALTYPMLPARYQNANLPNPTIATNTHSRKHLKTSKEISLVDLCQEISKRWKNADKETRAYFRALSKQDLLRYKSEMEAYNNTIKRNEKDLETSKSVVLITNEKRVRKRKVLGDPSDQEENCRANRRLVQKSMQNECDPADYAARVVNIIPPSEPEDYEIAMVKNIAKEQAASLSEPNSEMIRPQVTQEQFLTQSNFTWEQYLELYKVYLETLFVSTNPSFVP